MQTRTCTHVRARTHTPHTHAPFQKHHHMLQTVFATSCFTGHHGHLHGLVAAGSMAWLSRKCVQIASRVSLFLRSLLPGRALVKLSAQEVPVPWERSSPQERVTHGPNRGRCVLRSFQRGSPGSSESPQDWSEVMCELAAG